MPSCPSRGESRVPPALRCFFALFASFADPRALHFSRPRVPTERSDRIPRVPSRCQFRLHSQKLCEPAMILTTYRVAPSTIPGAGKGLFVDEPVAAGPILVAPDAKIGRAPCRERVCQYV